MAERSIISLSWELWVWIASVILSLVIIWLDCGSGNADGYVASVCHNGLGLFDILMLVFLAPFYLIYLLVAGAHLGLKWW